MAWSNTSKNTASYDDASKNTASYDNQSKNTATHTEQSKTSGIYFLLQEIGKFLLQENGHRIILQESIDWGELTLNTASYSNQTKN
jgi:hypothetical protein